MPERPRRLPAEIAAHLVSEFGAEGRELCEFLETAATASEATDQGPRQGETVAYNVREALTRLIAKDPSNPTGEWKKLSRQVVEAQRQLDAAGPEEQEGARSFLAAKIADLETFHTGDSLHRRRVVAALVARTGIRLEKGESLALETYVDLLDEAAGALHNSITVGAAMALLEKAVDVVGRLFMEPDVRDAALDVLADQDPNAEAVDQLLELVVTPRHMVRFLRRLETPAWVIELLNRGLLRPPSGNGFWPLPAAIEALKGDYAEELARVLSELAGEFWADPDRLLRVGRQAADLGPLGQPLVVEILRRYPETEEARWLAVRVCETANPSDELVEQVADHLLNPSREDRRQDYNADEIARLMVSGATVENIGRRLELVAYKIRALPPEQADYFKALSSGRLVEQEVRYLPGRMPALIPVATGLITFAAPLMAASDLLDLCEPFNEPTRSRLRAMVLGAAPVVSEADMLEHVRLQITSAFPTGDDILVIERLEAGGLDPNRFVDDLPLPDPPTPDEVQVGLEDFSESEVWRRVYLWAQVVPVLREGAWGLAVASIEKEFGTRSRESLRSAPTVISGVGHSPISRDEIADVTPLDAAVRIAAWRPAEDDWMVSARELARELEAAVESSVASWIEDPRDVVACLQHATYISHYLMGISKALPLDNTDKAGELVELVGFLADHPYPIIEIGRRNGFDFDETWDSVEEEGVRLIRRLAETDTGFGGELDAAWTLVLAEIERTRHEPTRVSGATIGPLEYAINRRPTKALDAALALVDFEDRATGTVRPAALDLLTRVLDLTGDDGAQHRAIMVTRLPMLHRVVPDWVLAQADRLFGDAAPDGLGPVTVGLVLQWGSPQDWLMRDWQSAVLAAAAARVDNALDHVILAMLRGVEGYEVASLSRWLACEGLMSSAGEDVGRLLREGEIPDDALERALAFWDAALRLDASGQTLAGFGWYCEIDALDQEAWAERTEATLAASNGVIDWSHAVAERAARQPVAAAGLSILNLLVRSPETPWELSMIMSTARAALDAAPELKDTVEYQRLNTALNERLLD